MLTINCYYAGFGAVHSIEFMNKDVLVWRSGIINQRLKDDITQTYTYENVNFYFLASYLSAFFKKYNDTKKINIFTSIDISMINEMIKNPSNESEQYLSKMCLDKKIVFDTRGDAMLYKASKDVAYAYFNLKKSGKEIKFGNGCVDPFADMHGDRYNVYG